MCIIAIKPIGKELMDKEIIMTMCESNPDGSGFCYAENGVVIIRKGFMDFESYYEALQNIPDIKNKNVVMHMRITTHGTTSKGNCHPFPLTNNVQKLKATEIKTDVAIIHNGIIKIEDDKKNDLSDTMTYIKEKLYPRYMHDKRFFDKKKARKKIEKEITSKMVIMKSDGTFHIIGNFNENDGYTYSNYSYIKTQYDYNSGYGYYNYGYYGNYGWSDTDIQYNTNAKYERYLSKHGKSHDVEMEIEEQNALPLEIDDFILIDGCRVYADEFDMFIISTGEIYYYDEYFNFTRVSSCAFDKEERLITYMERYYESVF